MALITPVLDDAALVVQPTASSETPASAKLTARRTGRGFVACL